MMTVTTHVRFTTGKAGRKRAHVSASATATPEGRIPRISKLMALAIKFDRMLRAGVVADQSELARLARVTQPRMTQILNLNHLAPDIQEELLLLPHRRGGRDSVHERLLRPIVSEAGWTDQRRLWHRCRSRFVPCTLMR